MQSKRELAEAGRRKLEEFRKAKAQGKAATTKLPSKQAPDASTPPPPPSGNAASLPTANGTANGFPDSAPATCAGPSAGTPSPPPPPRPAADTASQQSNPTHNGAPAATTSSPSARPWEQASAAPQPAGVAVTPTPSSAWAAPSPPKAPATSFVVLQNAPIPFGAPAAAPAGPASRTSSSGFTRTSGSGAAAAPPTGTAPWDVGPSQGQAQPRGSSDTATASSSFPWDSRSPVAAQGQLGPSAGGYAAANGPAGAADVVSANGVGGLFGAWGREQYSEAQYGAAASSSSLAGGAAFFGDHQQQQYAEPDRSAGSFVNGTFATPPPALPSTHEWPATKTDFSSWGNDASRAAGGGGGGAAAAEPWAAPGATANPNSALLEPYSHAPRASSDNIAAADTAPSASLGAVGAEWRPAQPAAVATEATPQVSEAPEAVLPSALAAPLSGANATGYGRGEAAAEGSGADARPPWLAHVAAAPSPLALSAPHEPPSASAVAATAPWGSPIPATGHGPQSASSAAAEAQAAAAAGAGTGDRGAAEADTPAASSTPVAAAGPVNAFTCYDQLSDSFLGAGSAGPVAGAPLPVAMAAMPPTPPPVSSFGPQPGDEGVGGGAALPSDGASPALPVSVPVSAAFSPGADIANSYSAPEAPAPAPAPVPAPAPASAPSRFAWLFGSPPPHKPSAPRENPTSSAAPAPSQPGPPPPSVSAPAPPPPSSAQSSTQPDHVPFVEPPPHPRPSEVPSAPPQRRDGAPLHHHQQSASGGEADWFTHASSAPRPALTDTDAAADASTSAGAWSALSGAANATTHHAPPPPPPLPSSLPHSVAPMAQQQQQQPGSPLARGPEGSFPGSSAGLGTAAEPYMSSYGAWDSSRAGLAGPSGHAVDYASGAGLSGGLTMPGMPAMSTGLQADPFGSGSLGTAAAPAAPPAAAVPWGAGAATPSSSERGTAGPASAGSLPWSLAGASARAYGSDRDALYGGGGGEAGVGPFGGDASSGPALFSFLRGVDRLSAAPGQEVFDRSAPASSAPSASSARSAPFAPPSEAPQPSGPISGPSRDTAAAATTALSGDFTSIPSFSTSFPALPLTAAPGGASASLPSPSHAAPPPPSRPPPAPAPPPPAASASAPHFSAAASYLSAYSTAGGSGPHGAAAATPPTTSNFLESYLDNLLATMSAPKDGAEDPSHGGAGGSARPGSATGMHPARGGQSAAGTPRHSHMGDAPAAAAAAAGEGAEEGAGDRPLSTNDLAAAGVGAGGAVLEGAGGSGRLGEGLLNVDSSAQLRSHHSRRVSVDSVGVLSVYSHATGFAHGAGGGSGHGHGGGSGVSRAQFAALQQHIDELTEEKLALTRGLQQQTRINEQLAEENEELMRQYNVRGAAMEELQRKVKQYEQELEAQALSLEGFSDERQAARSSYAEASSRAQALAAEVVGLEAQVLQLKSGVLKAERAAEEAQQRARKLEKQVETLTREAQERAQELQQTQLKGRNLVVKLKQTEAKLQAAEEKLAQQPSAALLAAGGPHSWLANGHAPPPPPPPKPTAEQEVQCDLEAELAAVAAQASRSDPGDGGSQHARRGGDDAVMAPVDGAGDGASVASGGGAAAAAGQLALMPQPSLPSSDGPDGLPDRLVRVDWDAARPQRDAASAVVAERALASLDSRALRAAARAGGDGLLPEGLDAVALQLARWLPAGPVSGGDPVAVMVEEELRLMQSIHELLGGFEAAQEATAEQIAELKAHVAGLTQENEELRHKLELQTQRLELQMQGMGGSGPGQPLSLHQTPAPSGVATETGSEAVAMTPVSGSYAYQPAQSFLPFQPETDSAVVTPTRSTRVTRLPSLDLPSSAAPPAKQTWMGYLFRSRQKKRTRSAIL